MKVIINPRKAVIRELINYAQFAQKSDLDQLNDNLNHTSQDLLQTKELIQSNFLGDSNVKAFVQGLAQKEVEDYKTIRGEFDGLTGRVTDLEDNLKVQEKINVSLEQNGYLTLDAPAGN